MRRTLRLLTAVAESDRSFALRDVRGRRAWVGPCSHCKKAIVVPIDEREVASATVEHIVPRSHGGGDELANLALACASCNHEKGRKLDWRRFDDPALQRVIERQLRERATRLRPS